MANLTLSIGGRPLKIQCSDQNIDRVKEIGETISVLIENEKKENVPFLTSTLIAYLKSMEEIIKKEKILQDSLNKKLFYAVNFRESLTFKLIGLKGFNKKIVSIMVL